MHNKDEIYIIDLKKSDIHIFYELISFGYYTESYKNLSATVWELRDNGFKSYITRKPIKRQKKNGQSN